VLSALLLGIELLDLGLKTLNTASSLVSYAATCAVVAFQLLAPPSQRLRARVLRVALAALAALAHIGAACIHLA
jgi:hypothetical protein